MGTIRDVQMYKPYEKNAESLLLLQAVRIVTTGL